MKIMSLKQFVQQQARERQDLAPRTLVMTVRDLVDALESNYEGDCTAQVILDSPESNSISVKFFPLEDESEE